MSNQPTQFPLCWPHTIPRAKSREKGQFQTSLTKALDNVEESLRLFGQNSGRQLRDVVMSSNVTLGKNRPEDPGVAVWFTWDGIQVCIPVDRYTTVEANLQAIHHIIEARRTELRHGTLALVRASFQGFIALPSPGPRHWSDILGLPKTAKKADIDSAVRKLMIQHHPDMGGDQDKAAEINRARDEAMKELGL